MKIIAAIALALISVVGASAQQKPDPSINGYKFFNTLEDLHVMFTANPDPAAAYIQGVIDASGLFAMAVNEGSTSGVYACLDSKPEIANAITISKLVEAYYLAHPEERPNSGANAIVAVFNAYCGLEGSSKKEQVPLNQRTAPIPNGKRT